MPLSGLDIFERREAERRREVDELIARGWGTTDPENIPANWRDIPGPDAVNAAMKRETRKKQRQAFVARGLMQRYGSVAERQDRIRALDRERKAKASKRRHQLSTEIASLQHTTCEVAPSGDSIFLPTEVKG